MVLVVLFLLYLCEKTSQDGYPKEGCQGYVFPPKPELYFENMFLKNETVLYNKLPEWAVEKITQILSEVVQIFESDYPPDMKPQVEGDEGVYFGSAGRALLFLRLYSNSKNMKYLNLSREYIDLALSRYPKGYDKNNFAFLKGRTGVVSVASVIYDLMGEPTSKIQSFFDEVLSFYPQVQVSDEFDLENGMAGLMYAARFLKRYFGKDIVPAETVTELGRKIFDRGMRMVNKTTGSLQFEIYKGHYWTGMGSHGLGSPIYELLQCDDLLKNETVRTHIKDTIDYVVSLQTPEGQIPGDLPHRTQWCHGVPGLLSVLGSAYEVFGEEAYLEALEKGVEFTAKEGVLYKGMQLCHGVAGNTYMVLDAFRKSKNPKVLSMAITMILTSISIPQLTDPKQWISYDCMPYMLYGSSSMGMIAFFSDILSKLDNLGALEMPGFHTSI